MLKVTEEAKGAKAYYRIKDVKNPGYDTWVTIELESATQEELKMLHEEGGHPFIKEVDKKTKASE